MPTLLRAQLVSFNSADWTAVVLLDGSVGEVVMPVGEWIPNGQLAADDEVAVLLFDESNPSDGLVLGPFGGVGGIYNVPPITGQPPTNGVVPIGRTSDGALVLAQLTGTSNQITVTPGAGSITLSTPQNIHTGATPTFAGLTLSNLTSGRVVLAGGSGALGDDADLTFNGTQLALATTGSSGGVLIGGDAQLYRSAADFLRTPDSLILDGVLQLANLGVAAQISARQLTIASGATADIGSVAKPHAWLFMRDTGAGSGNNMALYAVRGTLNTSHELFDVGGVWGTAAGASSYNVYRLNDAGGDRYVLQNNTGGSISFNIIEIRVN